MSAHYNLGIVLADDPDRKDGAEQAYQMAIQRDPEYAALQNNLRKLLGRE